MVSVEKYFKIIYHVFLQRIKLIKKLKTEKLKIDSKLVSGKELSSSEILILIDIIGKNTLFMKAEKRNKPTLRHMAWKFMKSIDNMKTIFKRYGLDKENKESGRNEMKKEFGDKLSYLYGELKFITSRLYESMRILDEIYAKESNALLKILDGKENLNAYEELIKEEERVSEGIKNAYTVINRHTPSFTNIIKALINRRDPLASYEERVQEANTAVLLVVVPIGLMFLTIVFAVNLFETELSRSQLSERLALVITMSLGSLIPLIMRVGFLKQTLKEIIDEEMI